MDLPICELIGDETDEARRPGIRRIMTMLRQKNPHWHMDRVRDQAKVIWHAEEEVVA